MVSRKIAEIRQWYRDHKRFYEENEGGGRTCRAVIPCEMSWCG